MCNGKHKKVCIRCTPAKKREKSATEIKGTCFFRCIARCGVSRHFIKEKTMVRILFVCHGNVCRSPMAEAVLKDMARREHLDGRFEIASAATSTEEIWHGEGNPIYPPARKVLAEHGIGTPDNDLGCEEKRARQMTREDYRHYDFLIGMDHENLREMRRIAGGDPEGKICLLSDFTAQGGEISDPWYTRDFETALRDIREGCDGLMGALKRKLPG